MWKEPRDKTGLLFVIDLKDGSESSLILNNYLLSTTLLFTHLTVLVEGVFYSPWPGSIELKME